MQRMPPTHHTPGSNSAAREHARSNSNQYSPLPRVTAPAHYRTPLDDAAWFPMRLGDRPTRPGVQDHVRRRVTLPTFTMTPGEERRSPTDPGVSGAQSRSDRLATDVSAPLAAPARRRRAFGVRCRRSRQRSRRAGCRSDQRAARRPGCPPVFARRVRDRRRRSPEGTAPSPLRRHATARRRRPGHVRQRLTIKTSTSQKPPRKFPRGGVTKLADALTAKDRRDGRRENAQIEPR